MPYHANGAVTPANRGSGSDAGKVGRRAEAIAHVVVKGLFEDLDTEATVDRHVADQLILFATPDDGRLHSIDFVRAKLRK